MNRKLKKFIKSPGIFFRDYLNKRYPVKNCEQGFIDFEENNVYLVENYINKLDQTLNYTSNFDVDVVFTWVNDQDPHWKNKKREALKEYCEFTEFSNNDARFENHNELFYSVNSVLKYLTWVRNIYIVTDNQLPIILEENEKIKIVDHLDIIDKKYLPTYNSHVIEANLHKIEGLSENFIYFNDDVFVAKPLEKSHFFRKNQIASIFVSEKNIYDMEKRGVITPTLRAYKNCIPLIKKRYGIEVRNALVHTYIPLKKSMYQKAWNYYEKEIESFLKNKLRDKNDLNLATFLVPWISYLEGKAIVSTEICYYF